MPHFAAGSTFVIVTRHYKRWAGRITIESDKIRPPFNYLHNLSQMKIFGLQLFSCTIRQLVNGTGVLFQTLEFLYWPNTTTVQFLLLFLLLFMPSGVRPEPTSPFAGAPPCELCRFLSQEPCSKPPLLQIQIHAAGLCVDPMSHVSMCAIHRRSDDRRPMRSR